MRISTLKNIVQASICVLPLMFSCSFPLLAQDKALGSFRDWSAHTFPEGGNIVCSMWSQPTKAEGKYKRRDEIYVFVTHRPANDRLNEVSFHAGYLYKLDSEVTVVIDDETFSLFTKDSTAWNSDGKGDKAVIQAMRAGSRMVVKGISKFGTLTTDTYSLLGFTAAYRAINSACKIK